MTEGSVSRHILSFSMPLLAGNVLQQMYNLVDSLVVGNFVGKEALAAVGGTFIISFLVVSLFSGLSLGFTIVLSQFFGAKNHASVRASVDTAYIVALAGALPVTLIGVALVNPLLHLVNTPAGATMEMSSAYLTIVFAGVIGTFGYNLNAGSFRA
jgi:Na+-driven multidrug efflux pump